MATLIAADLMRRPSGRPPSRRASLDRAKTAPSVYVTRPGIPAADFAADATLTCATLI